MRRFSSGKHAHAAIDVLGGQRIDVILRHAFAALLPRLAVISAGVDAALKGTGENYAAFGFLDDGTDMFIAKRAARDLPSRTVALDGDRAFAGADENLC